MAHQGTLVEYGVWRLTARADPYCECSPGERPLTCFRSLPKIGIFIFILFRVSFLFLSKAEEDFETTVVQGYWYYEIQK